MCKNPVTLMEVCGTHTVSIFRNGLRSIFPPNLKLLSGPGCPVCVTPQGEIDAALNLLNRENITLATYGDMLRVPGTNGSLLQKKGEGADVRIVLSASDTIKLARDMPEREIVFLAVGFETTAPATASLLLQVKKEGIKNLSVLCLHKRVPPVLLRLAENGELKVDGFILPGHVAVILGHEPFRFLPQKYGLACSIAGFEAQDILLSVADLLRQITSGNPDLTSTYGRAVRPEGNRKARDLMDLAFSTGAGRWRGLGEIADSALVISNDLEYMDACKKFDISITDAAGPPGCRCGEVLSGLILPEDCGLFGTKCTPVNPVGPCMVSSEGTCAAWYKYTKGGTISWQDLH